MPIHPAPNLFFVFVMPVAGVLIASLLAEGVSKLLQRIGRS